MRLTDLEQTEWCHEIATIIKSIDKPEFPGLLMKLIHQQGNVDSSIILMNRKNEKPRLIYDEYLQSGRKEYIERYLSGLYLLDPGYLLSVEEPCSGFHHLRKIAPENFFQSDYYSINFLKLGLIDVANYIVPLDNNTTIMISLGCLEQHQLFSESDIVHLTSLQPLVDSLVGKHWQGHILEDEIRSDDNSELHHQFKLALDNFGSSVLTHRELQITRLLLRGYTRTSIAEKLYVTLETIKSHQKNIYSKLNISSHTQLFSLFFESLANDEYSEEGSRQ